MEESLDIQAEGDQMDFANMLANRLAAIGSNAIIWALDTRYFYD